MNDPHGTAERLADALARNGAPVVFRRQVKSAGLAGLINPPRLQDPVLGADAAAGDTTVQIAATSASGRLAAGDKIDLGGGFLLLVGADTAARPPTGPAGFAAVPVSPGVPRAVPAGTPVAFVFTADMPTFGRIAAFPRRLVDGERIRSRDLNLIVSAWQLGEIVPGAWSVFVNGREMSVEDATPSYEGGEIVSWSVQAR